MPPAHDYLPPLATAEGVFAASSEELIVARYDASGWSMALLQSTFSTDLGRFVALVAGSGWIAAVGNDQNTAGGRVYVRRGGRWVDVTPGPGGFPSISTAWAAGSRLYVTGVDRVAEYDGSVWRTVDGAPVGAGYGDRTGMHVIGGGSLYWFDGVRSVAVPTPSPGEIRAVGGLSPDEVYALGNNLYRATAATLARAPDVDCGGPAPRYVQLATAPGRLVLVADCGGTLRAWSRAAGAWSPLGPLPANGSVAVNEAGELSLAAGMQLWRRVGGTWTALPEESPAPPSGVVAARSATDAWSLGPGGVARLSGDAWASMPAPAEFGTPTSAWVAPDGTLFVTTRGTVSAVWRFADGRWARDLFPGRITSNLAGRSSTDVWVGEGANGDARLRHWNGTTWETPPAPPCPGGVEVNAFSRVAVAGARATVVSCTYSGRGTAYYSDGGAWAPLSGLPLGEASVLTQFGPPSSPGALVGSGSAGSPLRTEAGWTPWVIPAPWMPLPGLRPPEAILRGSLPSAAVVWPTQRGTSGGRYFTAGFIRYDGERATVLGSWPAVHAGPGDTDTHWIIAPATCGRPSVPSASAIARCIL